MASPAGFEPTAYRLGICRSILLSYGDDASRTASYIAEGSYSTDIARAKPAPQARSIFILAPLARRGTGAA